MISMDFGRLGGRVTGRFVSNEVEFTGGVAEIFTFRHSFGRMPFFVRGVLVNRLNESGFLPQGEYDVSDTADANNLASCFQISYDESVIKLAYKGTNLVQLINDSAAAINITHANWRLKVYAAW